MNEIDGEEEENGIPEAPDTPEGGAPEGPATEELFAITAGLEDAPELDPVFRSALLESPDSATGEEQVPVTGEEPVEPEDGEGSATVEHDVLADESAEHELDEYDSGESNVTEEQTAILAAAARNEVQQAVEKARQTGEPWDPPRPPVSGDFQEPAKRPRYWWRFGLATLVIVLSFAGATSASILGTVNDITDRLSDPGFQNLSAKVLPPSNGGPQTIAILGSDVRTGGGMIGGDPGRSDTAILLRLDPSTGQIAMLSIPRDLKVEIPGYGTDKFNAAYAYGGTELTLKTIKSLTGLDINHVINVDFQGFADAIDAIGCVYADVDRDYYNSNEGKAPSEMYAEIDIDAGYQKLCGADALEYARYRHTDSDLVRASRQQDLISEVRNRLSFGEIIKRRNELIDAFTDNTRSDISGSQESLELLKLLFDSREARVVEVPFPASFEESYVVATESEIDAAVDSFLGFDASDVEQPEIGATSRKAKKLDAAAKRKARKEREESFEAKVPKKGEDGLIDAFDSTVSLAKELDGPARSDFTIFYPKSLPSASAIAEGSRFYGVRSPDKEPHGAYRMVFARSAADGTHYFGLQGLRQWEDPPILSVPSEEVEFGGRTFRIYPEGDRIKLVAWSDGGNTYWISNSLLLNLDNEEMLGMARSTRAFDAG